MALAIERIMLSGEVVQRNREAYFRTLVHDTSDVILIVDDDGSVRYATPSARNLFGDVQVEGARLADLVQPAERAEIDRALADMRAPPGSTRTGGSSARTAATWKSRSGAATCARSPPWAAWCSPCGT